MGKTNWLWTELQQKAFQELKNEVTSERVLIIPKPGRPFRMETDASDFAIAAILSQLDDEGKWRPVAFLSRSLNNAERNYEIYEKEMLAIMHGFYEWAHYLKGNDEITEVLNKISPSLESHKILTDDKHGGSWTSKNITSRSNTDRERLIQKPISYLEEQDFQKEKMTTKMLFF
jgi:hypothetical protein